jgi:RHS repeat-associated protein
VSTSNPIHKFTGKERDTETGNDYFGARYYSSTIGRFMSADWSDETDPVPYADEEDPRTLNLYAYVRNSPSNKRDADGHHQECGPTTYSTDSETGALTVNANCREVPDFFFCFFCSAATQAEIQSRFDDLDQRIALGQVYVYANTLPIGPGDTGALGDLESLLQDLKNGFRPTAESSALQEIVNQLYKTTDTVPGGTAGAVRQEIETGEAVGGKFHSIKAAERARQLEKLINAGTLSTTDTTLAKAILQDLWNALAGK